MTTNNQAHNQMMPKSLRALLKSSGALRNVMVATLLALGLGACVTVNVNFPESAVQSATDDYVKDLYRTRERGKGAVPGAAPTTAPSAAIVQPWIVKTATHAAIHTVLQLPVANASADETGTRPTLSLNSAKEQDIKSKLAALLDEVLKHKRAGALGESNDGMLVVKTTSPLLKKKLDVLVARENDLRAALYAEVQNEPGMKNYRIDDIKKKFARSFQGESPSGTWVQEASGAWSQKN